MALSVMSGRVTADVPGLVERVDAELARFLDGRAESFSVLGDDLVPVTDIAKAFVLVGGKRLRPRFAYWGWRTVHDDAEPDAGLITAAASLELLHACALVHDDVMDASDTRRGNPAAHTAFATLHRDSGWSGDPKVFGTAAAILLGDLLLSWADAMFASAEIDPANRSEARRVFDQMRQLVMAGQYLDVLVQARAEFSADEALRVIEFKTSKYTVEGPLHFGAAIAGAGPEVMAALSRYGLPLGEAFQLRDDVLGVFGDPDVTGKPAGDDLREGKQTLLTALAMRAADEVRAEQLRRDLGDRSLDADQITGVRNIIVATGALAQVEQRISERAAQARTALDDPALSDASRSALAELVSAATRRRT
ncbi:MAG TPA: polyprenyl synthetase family protein [Jatrophihabitans sp.]|jgi:geranylgeranyl diphosphate synthase type I|uniref:polyprenyl synthetase family protein n=1 Tax=Jatrophihabitans sp. TaxID=1932789 RepID=UPI002E08D8BB|nr:polyprenyl synthetase family protein [Jatrophihabitans sp.]